MTEETKQKGNTYCEKHNSNADICPECYKEYEKKMTPQWIEKLCDSCCVIHKTHHEPGEFGKDCLEKYRAKAGELCAHKNCADEYCENIAFISQLLTQQLEEVVRWSLNNHYDFIENEWRKYRGSKTCKELFLERYQKSLQTNV